MDFTTFVLSHLAPPVARVLEVGCGQGQLALALDALGYDVVAVDPVAPEGPIFRRIQIEELVEPQPFDAAVASYSLHHVVDLNRVLDKLCALLKPEGVLVVGISESLLRFGSSLYCEDKADVFLYRKAAK